VEQHLLEFDTPWDGAGLSVNVFSHHQPALLQAEFAELVELI
jgi:hypothetical protein